MANYGRTRSSIETDQRLLAVIEELHTRMGYPPTVRELVRAMGWRSTGSMYWRLEVLRDQGAVTWRDGKARTLRIVKREPRWGFLTRRA